MTVSLSTLIVPVTQDEAKTTILGLLDTYSLPTTSWTATSVPMVLVNAAARIYSDLSRIVSSVAQGGLIDLANGDWLTLKASDSFEEDRTPAVATVGTATLTDVGGSGPYAFTAGELYMTTAGGLRYFNSDLGELDASGTLTMSWTAEQPGSAYNVSTATAMTLSTPIPGVTIELTNIGSTGTWISTSGADEQSDDDLRSTCKAKWGSLSTGGNVDAYIYYAQQAAPNVARVHVDDGNPFGPGTVAVYLATAVGAASAGDVTLVDDSLQEKKSVTASVTTIAATAVPVAVTYTLYAYSASQVSAAANASTNLADYINGVDIGGTVYLSQIEAALGKDSGVRNVVLTSPVADTTLGANQVATFTETATVVAV